MCSNDKLDIFLFLLKNYYRVLCPLLSSDHSIHNSVLLHHATFTQTLTMSFVKSEYPVTLPPEHQTDSLNNFIIRIQIDESFFLFDFLPVFRYT